MGIVIFVIFLLSDLITVLICGFSYGKKYEYREGMVFGVHIPEEALKTEEVAGIIRKNKKNRKIFQIVNFVVSVGICFICFADFILFMIVWTVWITEYVAGVMYLIWHPNRRLYRIKIKNGWVRDSGRRIVRVDTGVSARSYRMALSLKYHIPSFVILMLCLLIIYLSDMSFGGEDMPGMAMIIASAAEFLCFFMIHIFVIRRPNIVHSQNSSVNYAANMLSKRGWSTGLIVSGYFCTASALYLIGRAAYMGWLNEFDFLIYMLFQLMTAVSLAIPVFRGSRKRQEILASDGEAFEVDDDEYWKNGWYSNPQDPHLIVPDRMNDMQFAMNMARPAAKVIIGATAALSVGILIFVAAVIFRFETAEIVFTAEGDQFLVEAAGYDCEFSAREVESVRLIESLPEDRFIRTNGGATDKYDIGYYRGEKTGKCMMFLFSGYEPILEIQLKEETVFVNSKNPKDTEEWYSLLLSGESENRTERDKI